MRPRFAALALAAGLAGVGLASGAGADGPARRESPRRVLHFDFFACEGATIPDASGHHHDGTLAGGAIAFGRRKNAAQLDGAGAITLAGTPATLDPAGRAFTVGALCQPRAPDGVLLAMGDQADGFCLYLKGGTPHFAVRAGGALTDVAGVEPLPLGQWVHLAGTLDADGTAALLVNTWPDAKTPAALLIGRPAEPLCVGADPGAPVVDSAAAPGWRGLIEDVRLYWGRLDRVRDGDDFKDWADMPGCGCKS